MNIDDVTLEELEAWYSKLPDADKLADEYRKFDMECHYRNFVDEMTEIQQGKNTLEAYRETVWNSYEDKKEIAKQCYRLHCLIPQVSILKILMLYGLSDGYYRKLRIQYSWLWDAEIHKFNLWQLYVCINAANNIEISGDKFKNHYLWDDDYPVLNRSTFILKQVPRLRQ